MDNRLLDRFALRRRTSSAIPGDASGRAILTCLGLLTGVVFVIAAILSSSMVDAQFMASANPDQPKNVSPEDGASGVSLTPTLSGSAFRDADGNTHRESSWQITSKTGDYDSSVFDRRTSENLTSIEVPSGVLETFTAYYWHVGYRDSSGAWAKYSIETSFTTGGYDRPPAVTTNSAYSIAMDSATLGMQLTDLGSAASVQVSFEYGQTEGYGNTTKPRTATTTGAYSTRMLGLAADTTYHFRAKAVGQSTAFGNDAEFTTSINPGTPPETNTASADAVTDASARLNGTLVSEGTAASVTVSFVWDTASGGPYNYETTTSTLYATGLFQFNLTGLASQATFYYKAKAVGDGTAYGLEQSFTTLPKVTQITGLSAAKGLPGEQVTLTITGSRLTGATAVDFGEGITVVNFAVVGDTAITATIAIQEDAKPGRRNVTVTSPAGPATASQRFEVKDPDAVWRIVRYAVAAVVIPIVVAMLALLSLWVRRRLARWP